jgi:hypothetical protein
MSKLGAEQFGGRIWLSCSWLTYQTIDIFSRTELRKIPKVEFGHELSAKANKLAVPIIGTFYY